MRLSRRNASPTPATASWPSGVLSNDPPRSHARTSFPPDDVGSADKQHTSARRSGSHPVDSAAVSAPGLPLDSMSSSTFFSFVYSPLILPHPLIATEPLQRPGSFSLVCNPLQS